MTDYASEMAKIFGGACSVENTDWTKERYFDSTSDCDGSEVALLNSLTAEAYNTYGFKVQYFIKENNCEMTPIRDKHLNEFSCANQIGERER